MGVRILESDDGKMAAIYCSTSMVAFGPVFMGESAKDDAAAFLKWLKTDPRTISEKELERRYFDWRVATDGE